MLVPEERDVQHPLGLVRVRVRVRIRVRVRVRVGVGVGVGKTSSPWQPGSGGVEW